MQCLSLHELGYSSMMGTKPVAFEVNDTELQNATPCFVPVLKALCNIFHSNKNSFLEHVNFLRLITILG